MTPSEFRDIISYRQFRDKFINLNGIESLGLREG